MLTNFIFYFYLKAIIWDKLNSMEIEAALELILLTQVVEAAPPSREGLDQYKKDKKERNKLLDKEKESNEKILKEMKDAIEFMKEQYIIAGKGTELNVRNLL